MGQWSKLLFVISFLSCSACYKARTVSPPQQPPEYEIYLNESSLYHSGYTKLDSTGYVFYLDTSSAHPPGYFLDFKLISGSPAAYQLKAYVVDLPPGLKLSFDTLSFRLNLHYDFGVIPGSFYGTHTSYLHIYNPDLGLKVYPLTFNLK